MINAPRRILVVDDAVELVELLTQLLDDEGYQVTGASTVAEATGHLRGDAFDLVLTDSFAARPDAVLTSTAALRSAAGATPIVLLTAHKVDLPSAIAAGFCAVMMKPFDLDILLGEVRRVLV